MVIIVCLLVSKNVSLANSSVPAEYPSHIRARLFASQVTVEQTTIYYGDIQSNRVLIFFPKRGSAEQIAVMHNYSRWLHNSFNSQLHTKYMIPSRINILLSRSTSAIS
jgi:hypothetical protein